MKRSLGEVVDWSALARTIRGASIIQPAAAVRRARGRQGREGEGAHAHGRRRRQHQAKAGTRAALDGLKLAEGLRDVARVATLAAAKGGKTRAILKLAGRGAIT